MIFAVCTHLQVGEGLILYVDKTAHGSHVARLNRTLFFMFGFSKVQACQRYMINYCPHLSCKRYPENQIFHVILYTDLFTAGISNNTGMSENASTFNFIEILTN